MADETPSDEPLELNEELEAHKQPGYHAYTGNKHNSGPYQSEEDAQSFIDGHLDGKGTIKHVSE